MPDLAELDQVLDTQTLTASGLILAGLVIVIAVLVAR